MRLGNTFTVIAAKNLFAHQIVSLTPSAGVQGEKVTVRIRGNDADFVEVLFHSDSPFRLSGGQEGFF